MPLRQWMTAWIVACQLAISAGAVMAAGGQRADGVVPATPVTLCSPEWVALIDGSIPTSDGQGHGPDLGSDEWKSVVEFRLGLRGRADVPERDDPAWCGLVDRLVRGAPAAPRGGDAAPTEGPSFPCTEVRSGSAEAMVCDDAELAGLDRTLADVYAAARARSANEHPPFLRAEQRGWARGRDECWKSADRRTCVRDAYVLRIAELQARYRLVAQDGPHRYVCGASPADEVLVTCFATTPPMLVAERGDRVSLMYRQDDGPAPADRAQAAASATYRGRNEWLRLTAGAGDSGGLCLSGLSGVSGASGASGAPGASGASGASGAAGGTGMSTDAADHGGEAVLVWGYQAPELRCRPAD
uniref:Lysozyme inhibitor LprI N-terminal domain-containing protein n=1 Tax=Nitratidesulfovibrio vulgaris (strain DSM 19637 / Miyazaki F) TaxID=883 RepID=B8DQB4_NITV9